MPQQWTDPVPPLPAHSEAAIRAIAGIHAEHRQKSSNLQRGINRITSILGRPGFTPIVTLVVVAWIGFNLIVAAAGHRAPDPPPFDYLFGAVSLAAFYMTGLILATQRHENELAAQRDQLTLQLTILNEQKSAKLIELVERLRLDHPDIANSSDEEAEIMASPADPAAVLNAIKQTEPD